VLLFLLLLGSTWAALGLLTPPRTDPAARAASVREAPDASPAPTCSPLGGPGPWVVRQPIPTAAASIPLAADGRYVYAAGGSVGAQGFTDRFARYDPLADAWTVLPPVLYADDGMTAVYAPVTGKLYLFGGAGLSGFPAATRVYDPAQGTWSWGTFMPEARSSVSAAYGNGKIYVAAGFHLGENPNFWVYDPLADTWDYLPSLPQSDAGAAAAVINGHFYLTGGIDSGQVVTTLYDYDIARQTWSSGPPLPVPAFAPGAAVVKGQFWVFGGRTASGVGGAPTLPLAPAAAQTFIFDPGTASWRAGPALPSSVHYVAGARAGNYTVAVGGTDGTTDSATTQVIDDPEQVCPAATPTPCAGPFSDVHPSDYFYTPVQYLLAHAVIAGYGDCTFRPYAPTTRSQLAKIIVLGESWALDTTGGPHFSDVPPSHPFYPFIETAYHRGIISGYADGTFRGGASVTRGQLAKIIVGAQGWALDTSGGPHFSDVPASNPFYAFVETAFHYAIISGYGDGTFHVGANATRGQISKIVYTALTGP
jgi:N-acetylneuraminic acid mutarotase